MKAIHIITVEIRGGLVEAISNIPEGVGIRIVDWDNIAAGDPVPDEDEVDYQHVSP